MANQNNENRSVHDFLQCTVKDAIDMLYVFCVRHNLNWVAMEDMASLINKILGADSLPTSKYLFKKRFKRNDVQRTIRMICVHCKYSLGNKAFFGDAKHTVCVNCNRTTSLETKHGKNFFVSLAVEPQILSILKEGIKNETLILERATNDDGTICDVHDACNYKQLKETYDGQLYITLTMSTDGAAVHKSAKEKSLWPLQIYVNEIKQTSRFKRENIICVGFAFGSTPDMATFMKPFIEEINSINSKGGLAVKFDENDDFKRFLVIPTCMTADSVAKCYILCKTQYNSHFGCPYCYHFGTVPAQTTQIKYSFQDNADDRTHEESKNAMIDALIEQAPVKGYYAPTPLLALDTPFDVVSQVVIDKMHSLDLGVVKRFFDIILNPKNKNES